MHFTPSITSKYALRSSATRFYCTICSFLWEKYSTIFLYVRLFISTFEEEVVVVVSIFYLPVLLFSKSIL